MVDSDMPEDEIPHWDVALAALVSEEHRTLGRPLRLQDFRRLAGQYAIRFDDIMVTMFQLVIHDQWQYRAAGVRQPITQETLDGLYVNRRLSEDDLRGYDGEWSPLA